MPDFTFQKRKGDFIFDDPEGRKRCIAKFKDGERGKESIRKIRVKSSPQLGYYYGLLLPEIHKEYLNIGVTVVMKLGERLYEREPVEKDSHIMIKDICALVGVDGQRMDVEDMSEYEMSLYIDHVLYHAVNDLRMDGEKLEAKRPERVKENDQ